MSDLTLRIEWSRQGRADAVRLLLRDGRVALAEASGPLRLVLRPRAAQAFRRLQAGAFPDPAGASPVESLAPDLRALGEDLFRGLLAVPAARRLWEQAHPHLSELRIEIVTAHLDEADPLPWELLHDPDAPAPLARLCRSFVRGASLPPEAPLLDPDRESILRVLSVIVKPPEPRELRFRSATRVLLRRLATRARHRIHWDVLRPPSFGRLSSALLEAEALGERYHVLHLEGGGVYTDLAATARGPYRQSARGREHDLASGRRGFFPLDHAQDSERIRLVDAAALGELLGEARTAVLTLANCCEPTADDKPFDFDPQRAFESIGRDLVEMGLPVLSSPFGGAVEDEANFWLDLYDGLAAGLGLGEATAAARRRQRDPRPHLVYEPVPAAVLQPRVDAAPAPPRPTDAAVDPTLPGFDEGPQTSRDGEILDIERLLNGRRALLLYGPTGCGKSWLAADYARWLVSSGGLDGPAIYSSFQLHGSLSSLLDQLASVFTEALSRNGFEWERIDLDERFDTALLVLSQIPVLWIWDSFELVNGDPELGFEPWSEERRQELAEFLDACADSQARILIASRDDQPWLGAAVRRRPVSPWDDVDRARLVERLLAYSHASDEPAAWRSATEYAAGNPLTIRLIVQEGLLEGVAGDRAVRELVDRVSVSSAQPDPLECAVQYALYNSFSDTEQEALALLNLFRGVVDTAILGAMAAPDEAWGLHDLLAGRSFLQIWAQPKHSILTRAARLGLLTELGEGVYRIEAAAARPLRRLFEQRYSSQPASPAVASATPARGRVVAEAADEPEAAEPAAWSALPTAPRQERYDDPEPPKHESAARRAEWAFVQAVSRFAAHDPPPLADEPDAAEELQPLRRLQTNEANLREACRIARLHGWWSAMLGAVRGLGALYETSARVSVWQETVDDLALDCVDEQTRGPLPGRAALWREVTDQRVRLANQRRVLSWALELQKLIVEHDRQAVRDHLQRPPRDLRPAQRFQALQLAESLHRLGSIARQDAAPLPEVETEAVQLCERFGQHQRVADWTYELGGSYTEISSIRDLAKAERWLRRGLEVAPDPHAGRARFLAALGQVAWERFRYARRSERTEAELIRHLMDARGYYERAIEHDDPLDYAALASHNLQFGHVSYSLGDIDRALPHYRDSIRYDQLQGNIFGAAKTRFNLAIALRDAGRLGEARKYAIAAFTELRALEGPVSEDLLDRARRLVNGIENRIEAKRQKRRSQAPRVYGW